ncbi:hypothetical protein PSAB6_220156 [Paraburkholderia sabiae]|nr:hypothetical protein PSAB6_220156 [Paraburkholderia sabiae]
MHGTQGYRRIVRGTTDRHTPAHARGIDPYSEVLSNQASEISHRIEPDKGPAQLSLSTGIRRCAYSVTVLIEHVILLENAAGVRR